MRIYWFYEREKPVTYVLNCCIIVDCTIYWTGLRG